MYKLNKKFKHQIENSEKQNLVKFAEMFEIYQKKMNNKKIVCTCHVFLLKQKLKLSDSIIDLKNFTHLNRALTDVHDFLLMTEKRE